MLTLLIFYKECGTRIITVRLTRQLFVNLIFVEQMLLDFIDLDRLFASIYDGFPKALAGKR